MFVSCHYCCHMFVTCTAVIHRELILQVGPRRMLLRQDLKSQLNLHPNLHINLLLTPLDLSLHPHNQLTELQLHKLPLGPIGTLHPVNQTFMCLERHGILDHHHPRYCSFIYIIFCFTLPSINLSMIMIL